MENSEKLSYVEFEVKFKVEGDLVYDFKKLAQTFPELQEFLYIESEDIYFVKGDEFIRHRFDRKNLKGRQEITYKRKRDANNIYRIENNVRCDGNKVEDVAELWENLGFKKNFSINKFVHIYVFPEVTLPFYTVIDEAGEMTHFIEIEINEEKVVDLTEEQCWNIIKVWEQKLAPLGISAQKRLRRSLFEIYRKS